MLQVFSLLISDTNFGYILLLGKVNKQLMLSPSIINMYVKIDVDIASKLNTDMAKMLGPIYPIIIGTRARHEPLSRNHLCLVVYVRWLIIEK